MVLPYSLHWVAPLHHFYGITTLKFHRTDRYAAAQRLEAD